MEHLAANIALLGLVTDAPEAPSLTVSTPPRESPTTASLRTIKFKHERLISQNLAFICANSNDPLRIMATCIEEDHPNERLIIRFAANKGTYEELMESMRHIVRILQDESNNMNRATNPESLLRRVLALNRKRILSRLRHKHATSSRKTKNRRSMLDRLGKAAGLLRNSPLSTVRSQEITNQVHGLNKRSEILENMSAEQARSAAADEQILRLVQDIDSFVAKYGADLLLIPNISADWTPGSTSALLDRMGKVSHYVKACNELLTAARRYPIFSHVTSCFVNLQQIRPSRNSNGKSPDNALPKDLIASGTILRLAKRDRKSPADVTQLLSERLGQTSKLHAEIQLLLYYEIHSTALPPRIISSSKKACYLCKLLFELHGKFVVPGSHGHLYDSWKWPSPVSYTNNAKAEIVSLDMLLPRFMAIIEQKIWQGLEKKGKRSDDDCESRVSNGSFTATVVSTSSGASVSTIRASRNVRSATFPSCAQANQNLPTSSSKSDSSERSRSATRHELTMIEMTDLSADKNFQHEIHLPIRNEKIQTAYPHISHTAEPEVKLTSKLKVQPPNPKRQERHDSTGNDSWLPIERSQTMENTHQKKDIDNPSNMTTYNKGQTTPPYMLQPGTITIHPLTTTTPILHICTPKLHLHLDVSTAQHSPTSTNTTKTPNLQINIQWLDQDQISFHSQDKKATIIDITDIALEKEMPEGVLFSTSGLILRRRDTMIRIYAVI